jgi:diacylglycerol kinase (ATP)
LMRILALSGPRSLPRHVDTLIETASGKTKVLETPSLDQVAAELEHQPPDVVAVFGGDGTLNRYLALLHHSQIPVLTIPSGSGNDFAMACGLASTAAAMHALRDFQAGALNLISADLGCASFDGVERLFACCLNIGLDADAAQRTNRLPDWLKERKGYFLAGAAAVLNYRPQPMSITGDMPAPISGSGWFVAVSNTPTYGGGLKIAPQAVFTDGCLDVTYLQPIPRLQLIRHFPKILSGRHVRLPMITSFTSTRLSVATSGPTAVYADGEFFGQTPVVITVVRRAIRALAASPSR